MKLNPLIPCLLAGLFSVASSPARGNNPHGANQWSDYPNSCLGCHQTEFEQMSSALHYTWVGDAPDMVNQPGTQQGKMVNSINSYCIHIEGNWGVCGSCHAGRGKQPNDPTAGLTNIDCLMCHNEDYAWDRARLDDGSMGPPEGTPNSVRNGYVKNISMPTRSNCLRCHAKAGGGDGVKRGDIALADIDNTDPHFDVHMNVNGPDLDCQDCHTFVNHRVTGKGSDLRPVDHAAEVACTNCHQGKDMASGHASAKVGDHQARVSCQACHIPTYGKTPTEVFRDWTRTHDGEWADPYHVPEGESGHPYSELSPDPNICGADLPVPEYRFWNRLSDNYLLGDDALATYDADRGTYPTSRPVGDIDDGKLYPFKYKTAYQPMVSEDHVLIPLDTYYYLKDTSWADEAAKSGMASIGYPEGTPYEWVLTDTFALLNHGVPPASAVSCSQCHESLDVSTDSMLDDLGYRLKAPKQQVCSQCHDGGKPIGSHLRSVHRPHLRHQVGCGFCHSFERPERGLCSPCDAGCVEDLVTGELLDHSDICD